MVFKRILTSFQEFDPATQVAVDLQWRAA